MTEEEQEAPAGEVLDTFCVFFSKAELHRLLRMTREGFEVLARGFVQHGQYSAEDLAACGEVFSKVQREVEKTI